MKLTETYYSFNIQQSNDVQDRSGKANVKDNLKKNIDIVKSLPIESIRENSVITKSANIIKDFFRQIIADKSYNRMFSQGTYFKELGTDLPKRSAGKSSLYSLQHLNNISKNHLTKIKEKIGNLTPQEKNLLSKVVNTNLHFRHQSNANLSGETLNIMSNYKLQIKNISTASNTYPEDIKCLSNHDFVFFGVEFSDDKSQLPLNTKHTTIDYGANAYITNEQYPYGYLTLTDHFDNQVPPAFLHEHQKFISQFSEVRNEIGRYIYGENGRHDIPIYNTKDMKVALGLHLIDFLRNSSDFNFKALVLNEDLNSEELDHVLNFVFQPEFHVPRMVSTTNFKKVKLREISLEELIELSNIEGISVKVKNKNDACQAMGIAIKNFKPEVVVFLFSQWEFTREDTIKISSYDDIEYLLSSYSNTDSRILKMFLERGLVEPNAKFKKTNTGDTMLNNAIKDSNKEMISLLLEYGAVRGEELAQSDSDNDSISDDESSYN